MRLFILLKLSKLWLESNINMISINKSLWIINSNPSNKVTKLHFSLECFSVVYFYYMDFHF